MSATPQQIKTVHVLRRAAGLDEDTYRDVLFRQTGARSLKLVSKDKAARLIDHLKGLSNGPRTGQEAGSQRPLRLTLSGSYAPILRALWLSAWNLGLARSRDDAAIIAFVTRQTGLTHPRFMIEPAQAYKAIEGLKGWLTRAGGLEWPKEKDVLASKKAVLLAQLKRAASLGVWVPGSGLRHVSTAPRADLVTLRDIGFAGEACGITRDFPNWTTAEWDQVSAALGRRIRSAQAKAEKSKTEHSKEV